MEERRRCDKLRFIASWLGMPWIREEETHRYHDALAVAFKSMTEEERRARSRARRAEMLAELCPPGQCVHPDPDAPA